jgi:2-polyprenyl-3-methyl-5-hydroxy-6-metoxy-1,4-benzoquinol methylase
MALCPACHAQGVSLAFRQKNACVVTTAVFDSTEEAKNISRGDIDLHHCATCGLIFNALFDENLAMAAPQTHSSQGASQRFLNFSRSLALEWTNRHQLCGRDVLEVGCGQGEFLEHMVAAGARHAIGVDPKWKRQARSAHNSAIHLQATRFDASSTELPGHALICRHTLEHVGDVFGFLQAAATWARQQPGRVLLFEVPAAERIITERAFWDVYYEHATYWTRASLIQAFERQGLHVSACTLVFDDQYLLLEACALAPSSSHAVVPLALETCRQFVRDIQAGVDRVGKRLAAMDIDGRGVVLWQGAAKTVGLLSALGSTTHLRGAVDQSPQRQGKFLPGSGLEILAPQALATLQPRHVVLMNAAYTREVAITLERLSPHSTLHTINDLFDAP